MSSRPLICVLATCHRDVEQAKLWLRWAAYLSRSLDWSLSREHLVIVPTRRVASEDVQEMADICRKEDTFFNVTIERPRDEDENGYPGSASHLFVRSLEIAGKHHPNSAVMFCEPDTAPLRPSWFQELACEYESRGTPFVGKAVPSTADAINRYGFPPVHMTGNGIYPPNALRDYPAIAECLRADRSMSPWGDAGYAWDLYAAHEIMPFMSDTDLVQQIWEGDPWTPNRLARLNAHAAFAHRSKDGTLIYSLAERSHPGFLASLPSPKRRFMLVGSKPKVVVHGITFEFTPCARDTGARLFSVYRPENVRDEAALKAESGRNGLTEIDAKEYDAMIEKSCRFRY